MPTGCSFRTPRSERNYESTAGFEWKMDGVSHSGTALLGSLWPFVSLDLRHRTRYDYNRPTDDALEETQWSVNLLLRLRRADRRFLQKGLPELYVRFYQGVKPHGQFRSQRNYTVVGVGLHVPVGGDTMALTYQKDAVLWTYHLKHPSRYGPTAEMLQEWDAQLTASYECKIRERMDEFDIPFSRPTKSRIVALAEVSNENRPGTRVRNACRFYSENWNPVHRSASAS